MVSLAVKVFGALVLCSLVCEATLLHPRMFGGAKHLQKQQKKQQLSEICVLDLTCVGFNATCGANRLCEKGLYCHETSLLCVKLKDNGTPCAHHGECKSVCLNDTCQDEPYAKLGESCEVYPCVLNTYCSFNIDTNNHTCRAYPTMGQECSGTCAGSAICQYTASICMEAFSQEVNQTCSSAFDCKPGLYCSDNNYCTVAFKGSGKNCTDDIECLPEEDCDCLERKNNTLPVCVGPETFTQREANIATKYADCVYDHKCESDAWQKDGNVVICPSCKNEICDYVVWYLDFYYKDYPICTFGDYVMQIYDQCQSSSSPSRTWIWIVVGVAAAVAVVLIAALIIWKVKSSNNAERETLVRR